MKIKKRKSKRWKVDETRTIETLGGYSFYCACGKFKTTQKGDRLKVTRGKFGYIYEYNCPDTKVMVVLEHM